MSLHKQRVCMGQIVYKNNSFTKTNIYLRKMNLLKLIHKNKKQNRKYLKKKKLLGMEQFSYKMFKSGRLIRTQCG